MASSRRQHSALHSAHCRRKSRCSEERGCQRIGFEDSAQLIFRRGGFMVLVKRVAKYEVIEDGSPTVVTVPSPETLFPRALLHSSTVAHIIVSKFGLGVPHYRLEQALADQGVALDRGTMSRYVEHAGNTLGATVVHAMWRHVAATGATPASEQPIVGWRLTRSADAACA